MPVATQDFYSEKLDCKTNIILVQSSSMEPGFFIPVLTGVNLIGQDQKSMTNLFLCACRNLLTQTVPVLV